MKQENKEWITNLKPGDKVCLDYDGIGTVARVTKTMIVLDNKLRFNINSGWSVGTTLYGSHYIQPITDEVIERVKIKRINKFIVNFKYENLNQDQKNKVYELLKSFQL